MVTFDFEQNFFSSSQAELAEHDSFTQALDELNHLRGKVAGSAGHLLNVLHLYENVLVQFIRLYTYHFLRLRQTRSTYQANQPSPCWRPSSLHGQASFNRG